MKPNQEQSPRKDDLAKLSHTFQVRFALYCARQVPQTTPEAIRCIEVVDRWLIGEASSEECHAAAASYTSSSAASAAYAASAAAASAASAAYAAYAAYTAAYAAYAASASSAYAAYAADINKAEVIADQWTYYYELLNMDEVLERGLQIS
jgi:hypothetical protein